MPQTRSALSRRAAPAVVRRLVGALAATGLATTLGWAALASPAAQASDDVTVSNVTTTSEKAETWATVNLTADWSADHPTAGQTLTVTLGDGLKWPDGLDFKLINKDAPDVSIGDCAAAADTGTLTCTLNKNVEQWNHVDGSLWAHGQLTDQAVGKTSLSVTVNDRTATVVPGDGNGDGTCDAGCGGVTAPPADKDTHKSGWFTKKEDGTYTWTWDVNVNGSKEYTVVDHNATFQEVACTDSDWTKSWKPENVTTNGDSVHWTVPSADTVCHARYTTQTTTDSASNTATVNDKQYDATTDAQAIGGGDGVGVAAPPSTTSTPSATPSASPTPTPTPSETSSAPAVPPSSTPSESAPVATPPSATPSKTPGTPSLARTGAAAATAGLVAVVAMAVVGAARLRRDGALLRRGCARSTTHRSPGSHEPGDRCVHAGPPRSSAAGLGRAPPVVSRSGMRPGRPRGTLMKALAGR
ncbi:MAG: Ig-like domain-containing protein [Actinomyces sp.]